MEVRRPLDEEERERRHRAEHDYDSEQEHVHRADASRGLETHDRREPARLWQELSRSLGELRADESELR